MSLNSKINKELYKGLSSSNKRKVRVVTFVSKEQKEEVISLFMKGGNNTTPIIAEKVGLTISRTNSIIDVYLKKIKL